MTDVLYVILQILGIATIVLLGAFLLSLMLDAIFSAFSSTEGVYFNKSKKEKATKNTYEYGDIVVHSNVDNRQQVVESVEKNTEEVTEIDFDKAVEEQKALQAKIDEEQKKVAEVETKKNEEDYDAILDEVTKEALVIYNDEAKQKVTNYFKISLA